MIVREAIDALETTALHLLVDSRAMIESKLTPNSYGNFDVRAGCPSGGMRVSSLPSNKDDLTAAGIVFGQAFVAHERKGRVWKPVFDGWVIERDWESKLRKEGTIVAKLREQREATRTAKHSQAAKRAAATRRKNKLLATTPYGRFLLTLRSVQNSSDQAKKRRKHWNRAIDYSKKSTAIDDACRQAVTAEVSFGWKTDDSVNSNGLYVCYFDLCNGQVSFHSPERGDGPEYEGTWDGVEGVASFRIEQAIETHLNSLLASN